MGLVMTGKKMMPCQAFWAYADKFQQTTFWNICLIFSRKQALTCHAKETICIKAYFLKNIKQNMLSAEFACRVENY